MIYIIIASILWGFSFGLIKTYLSNLDPNFVAFVRAGLAFIIFLPFLRVRGLTLRDAWKIIWIGVIQYGMCYLLYLHSFQYLKAYEVALFVTFTPIYITLIYDIMQRRFNPKNLLIAMIAVIGAASIKYEFVSLSGIIIGFFLLQFADGCAAWGQLQYKRLRMEELTNVKDHQVFALSHLGAFIVTTIATVATGHMGEFVKLTSTQINVLIYLGLFPTGLAYYFANKGAVTTSAGTLAVLSNLKIPIGVLAALFVFGEQTDLVRLAIGMTLILGALVVSVLQKENPTNA